jgi:hypothetical protein
MQQPLRTRRDYGETTKKAYIALPELVFGDHILVNFDDPGFKRPAPRYYTKEFEFRGLRGSDLIVFDVEAGTTRMLDINDGKTLKVVKMARSGGSNMLTAEAFEAELRTAKTSEDEKDAKFEKGKPADPTKNMSPADKKEWEKQTEEHKDEFKEGKFEKGKPADPTENMSKEDAAEWDRQNDEHKDNFKAADLSIDAFAAELRSAADESIPAKALREGDKLVGRDGDISEVMRVENAHGKLRIWTDTVSHPGSFFDVAPTQKVRRVTAAEDKDESVSIMYHVRGEGGWKTKNFKNQKAFEKWGDDMDEKWGSGAYEVRVESKTASVDDAYAAAGELDYTAELKVAAEDEKEGKFEKGKPADPTENMSPEDAKEWKDQTEEHKDEFKAASYREAAGLDPKASTKLVEELADELASYFKSKLGSPARKTIASEADVEKFVARFNDGSPTVVKAFANATGRGYWSSIGLNAALTGVQIQVQLGTRSSKLNKDFFFEAKSGIWPTVKGSLDAFVDAKRTASGRTAAETSKEEWEKALKIDEELEEYLVDSIKTLESGGKVDNLKLDYAKKGLEGVRAAIKNKKFLISKLAADTSKEAEWKGWNEKMPVQVVEEHGTEVFENLAAAKKKHPELDPTKNTKKFTWATHGEVHGKPAIRFESWPVYHQLSRAASESDKVAASGLYGFTKEAEKVCGAATNRLKKFATKLAKEIYVKDANTPAFLEEHEKRAGSRAARMLRASMSEIGPGQPGKTAARRDGGRYGFSSKTAKLGLQACSDLDHEAGVVANDLHSRMGTKYAAITGFLNKHAKRAKCGWSEMILDAYPPAPAPITASLKPTVAEILSWEGTGQRIAASFLASDEDDDETPVATPKC